MPDTPGSIAAKTSETLARITRANETLKAFTAVLGDTAMAEAALADQRSKMGDTARVLHGLPIAVKDIIDVAGIVSGCGSLTQRGAKPAIQDAACVARLREAGAVIPAKTHTVEFAFGGYGTNITVGTPWNPWDLKTHRIPGGSSSGSGVAVGAGLVPGALGTDTGGSVRIPAALCGCVGLKTSVGRIGRSRVAPLSQTLDSVGPIAESVEMAARMFVALQGVDPDDPSTGGVKPADPFPELDKGIERMRVGRIADADMPLTSAEMRADFAAAIKKLEDLGARVTTLKLPRSFDEYGVLCGDIIAPEAYANWQRYADDPASGLAVPIRHRMMSGKISAAAYIQTIRRQAREIQDFLAAFDRFDAIVLPTLPFPAIPVAEVDENRAPMAAHTRWVNYLNLAGLALPTALSASGLPMSLQIVVRHMDDSLALRIGRAFELRRGKFPAPPAG